MEAPKIEVAVQSRDAVWNEAIDAAQKYIYGGEQLYRYVKGNYGIANLNLDALKRPVPETTEDSTEDDLEDLFPIDWNLDLCHALYELRKLRSESKIAHSLQDDMNVPRKKIG